MMYVNKSLMIDICHIFTDERGCDVSSGRGYLPTEDNEINISTISDGGYDVSPLEKVCNGYYCVLSLYLTSLLQ